MVLALADCGAPPETDLGSEQGPAGTPEIGQSRQALYGQINAPQTYWNGVKEDGVGAPAWGAVEVCWGRNATLDRFGNGAGIFDIDPIPDYPGFAVVSRWWREAVEDTWGRYAFIQFRGWDTCVSRNISDENDRTLNPGKLMLFYGDTPASGSVCGVGRSPTTAMPCFVSPTGGLNFRQIWQSYGIHEVGHGLGFGHEQVRPDNWAGTPKTTQTCLSTANHETGPESRGMVWNVNGQETWVDKESVLCYDQAAGYQLSAGDVMGLQRVYGRKPPGSVIGYGGRSAAIFGGTQASGTPLVSWPTDTAWTFNWRADRRPNAQPLDLMSAYDGITKWYWRVQNGAVVTTSSVASATTFARSNMRWKAIGDMCVVASGASPGASLSIQKCGTGDHERWDFFRPSAKQVRLNGTNLCVAASSANPALGDLPKLANCASTGTSTQNFDFDTTHNYIRFSSLCMAVFGGFPKAGATVGLWNGCDVAPQMQHFQFNMTGRLKNGNNCAAWDGNVSDSGRAIKVRTCQPAPAAITNKPDKAPFKPQDPQDWDMYW